MTFFSFNRTNQVYQPTPVVWRPKTSKCC